jgi:HPt (histidine-containing phosphotransfer) domain-containing protein
MNTDSSRAISRQIDVTAALAGLGGNRELLSDLSGMFCEDAPVILRALRQAVDSDDPVAARRAAHSIKGAAATFYARPTIEHAERLELEAAAGNLEPLKTGGLDELEQCVLALITELHNQFPLISP